MMMVFKVLVESGDIGTLAIEVVEQGVMVGVV